MVSFVRLRRKDTAVFGGEQAIYMRGGLAYMNGENNEENLAFM
jgi:hypothetical protein